MKKHSSTSRALGADLSATKQLNLEFNTAESITADLTALFTAFDLEIADLPLAEKLAAAGQWLAHLADLYASRADWLLTGWQNKHHPTEPILTEALDDLFVQSQSLDLDDFFEESTPHYYPAERVSSTTQVGEISKQELLNWVDTQTPEAFPNILTIPEDEDPSAWMTALASFWQSHLSDQVRWPDLQAQLDLPASALLLALLLGGYPHHRQPETGFYDLDGIWIERGAAAVEQCVVSLSNK